MLRPLQTQLMTSSGRKKTESNCLANFPRTISQTSSLFRHSQQKKEKLEARTKSILDKFSDLTYTKQYALTDGPKRGRGVNVGHSLSPPPPLIILYVTEACPLLRILCQSGALAVKCSSQTWNLYMSERQKSCLIYIGVCQARRFFLLMYQKRLLILAHQAYYHLLPCPMNCLF